MEDISRLLRETNQRLERLYDAIETGKISLDDLEDRIRELRRQQAQLQARRLEIETNMSDKKVELVDLNAMTGYVAELQEILKEGTLAERRAFIRSFIKEIKVTGDEALMTYSPPIP
jgi:site-specific DNA recombinase